MEKKIPVWPEWEIVEQLGEGAYGKVYKAKRVERDAEFYSAIKVISIPKNQSELSSAYSEHESEESLKAYFQGIVDDCINEVKILESLKGTANIIGVEDYQVVEYEQEMKWDIYIRMELSTNFITYAMDHRLTEDDIIQMGIDICSALEYCTKLNVIHRDIKPENIFVSKFGQYKLGDFGIARKLERIAGGLSQKGTYHYMAPEVYHGQPYGANIDIYSLGMVLYKLLNNNQIPLLNQEKQQLTYQDKEEALARKMGGENLPPPCRASHQLASIILKACSYHPAHRYHTPQEMKRALLAVQDGATLKMDWDHTVGVRSASQGTYESASAGQNSNLAGRQELHQSVGKAKQSKIPFIVMGAVFAVVLLVGGAVVGKLFFDGDADKADQVVNENTHQEDTQQEDIQQEEAPAEEQNSLETGEAAAVTSDQEAVILNEEQVAEDTDSSKITSIDGTIYQADVYEYLTLRESPSTSAPAVCLLPLYTKVQIIEDSNSTMVKVATMDTQITGYVNKEYLTPEGAMLQRAGKKQDTYSNMTIYYADVYETMTLRNAASTDAATVAYLEPYTAMYIIGKANGMANVHVVDSGLEGWVNPEYLSSDVNSFVRAGKSNESAADTFVKGQICYAAVNEFLTLRDAPDTSGNAITTLKTGTQMEVLEVVNDEYCQVKVSETGEMGYVMSAYLE